MLLAVDHISTAQKLDKCITALYNPLERGVDLMNQKGLEPMVQMNIRIDRIVKEELERLARLDRRPISEYVRLLLEDHVNANRGGGE